MEHLNTIIPNFDGIRGRSNPYSRGRFTSFVEGFTSPKRFFEIIYFSVRLERSEFFRLPFTMIISYLSTRVTYVNL